MQRFGADFGADLRSDLEADLRSDFGADFDADFEVDFEVDFEADFEADFETDFEADFAAGRLRARKGSFFGKKRLRRRSQFFSWGYRNIWFCLFFSPGAPKRLQTTHGPENAVSLLEK